MKTCSTIMHRLTVILWEMCQVYLSLLEHDRTLMEVEMVYVSHSTVFHNTINTHGKHEMYKTTDNKVWNTALE